MLAVEDTHLSETAILVDSSISQGTQCASLDWGSRIREGRTRLGCWRDNRSLQKRKSQVSFDRTQLKRPPDIYLENMIYWLPGWVQDRIHPDRRTQPACGYRRDVGPPSGCQVQTDRQPLEGRLVLAQLADAEVEKTRWRLKEMLLALVQ